MGEAGDSLEDITKKEGLAVRGVAEKRKETKFGEGGKGNRRHTSMRTDSGEGRVAPR